MEMKTLDKYQYFKLGDLIELNKGKRAEPKEDGKYPIYGAGEKETGYTDTWNNDGRITITRKGTVGKIYKREFKHFVTEASFIVEVKSEVILEAYLYEWLKNKEQLIMQLKTSALIPNLDEKSFLNLKIKVPNLERQRKVVYTLKSYRYALEEYEELLKKQMELLNDNKFCLLNEIIEKMKEGDKK
jgi:type I restriction enzyme S subunit